MRGRCTKQEILEAHTNFRRRNRENIFRNLEGLESIVVCVVGVREQPLFPVFPLPTANTTLI